MLAGFVADFLSDGVGKRLQHLFVSQEDGLDVCKFTLDSREALIHLHEVFIIACETFVHAREAFIHAGDAFIGARDAFVGRSCDGSPRHSQGAPYT